MKDSFTRIVAAPRQSAAVLPLGPSLCNIRCQCGHEADLGEFTRTPVNGDLPHGHYQCPACSIAWHIKPGKVQLGRYFINEPNQIIYDQAQL